MSENIKIFVSNRIDKECETIQGNTFVPVRCGACFDKNEAPSIIGDDTGDNISGKRLSLCELTVQYWAWKNAVEDAEYVGLCHYRRYFSFSKFHFAKSPYGLVREKYIDEDSISRHCLDDEHIAQMVKNYDVIVPELLDASAFPEHFHSNREQWNAVPYLHKEDLELMKQIIAEKYPDFVQTAEDYLNDHWGRYCCMFIMKKDIFNDYCQWLFDILFEFEKRCSIENYSEEGVRTPGHLGERLLGIYIKHLAKNNPSIRIKELQIVFFEYPEKLEINYSSNEKNVVPVVMAASNDFVPMVSAAIQSIIHYSNHRRIYKIYILNSSITKTNQQIIQMQSTNNCEIHFVDIRPFIDGCQFSVSQHLAQETYYRFLIQDIFPNYKKVLFLDSDVICQADIAELFDTDINGFMLAAVYDADMQGQMSMHSETLEYALRTLKMKNPYQYFQAGVILFNLEEMRKKHTVKEWLSNAADTSYLYVDQDILNRYCYGHVKFLEMKWNTLIDCDHYRVPVTIANAPMHIKQAYDEARKNPAIIHYAGYQKPWNTAECDMFEQFWNEARTSPFYEKLLFNLMTKNTNNQVSSVQPQNIQRIDAALHQLRVIHGLEKDGTALQRLGLMLLPVGSLRRAIVKKLLPIFKK